MLQFKPQLWINIGHSLATIDRWGSGEETWKVEQNRGFFFQLQEDLNAIGCVLSAKMANHLGRNSHSSVASEILKERARMFRDLVFDEMSSHLFLWVPQNRSEWYE
jgi:hypothetical protein